MESSHITGTGRRENLNHGFTLIEILVALLIVSILSAVLLPAIIGTRKRASAPVCISNMKQIYAAYAEYAQDHDGLIPPYQTHFGSIYPGLPGKPDYTVPDTSAGLLQALNPYTKSSAIWFCPCDPYAHTNSLVLNVNHLNTSYFSDDLLDYIDPKQATMPLLPRPVTMDPSYTLPAGASLISHDPSNLNMFTDNPNGYVGGDAALPVYSHNNLYVALFFDGHVKSYPLHAPLTP